MNKYKISSVSYLNSLPFIYGFNHYKDFRNKIKLSTDIPSVCADKLKNNEVDIGLIPVAELPNIPQGNIISDYCIGAVGEVKTVLLVSDVPLLQIKTILLDYQSRTSVALCRVLAREFWKINPTFTNTQKNYETNISKTTAGVIIGDRTLIRQKITSINMIYQRNGRNSPDFLLPLQLGLPIKI